MSTEDEQATRQMVMQLLSDALGPGIDVYAFGSRAREEARPASDLDLLLRAKKPIRFAELAEAAECLAESDLPYAVDLLDDARISRQFRQRIEADLVCWGRTR